MKMTLGPFVEPIEFVGTVDEDGNSGEYQAGAGIKIRTGLTTETEAYTLVHEGLHNIVDKLGMMWDTDQEEEFVRRLTPWLLMWVVQNPEMWGHIISLLGHAPQD